MLYNMESYFVKKGASSEGDLIIQITQGIGVS